MNETVSAIGHTESSLSQNSEYIQNKENLIQKGYSIEDEKFEYGGLIYTKVFHTDGSYGLIEENSDHVTVYLITPETDGTYNITAENANGIS